MGLDGNIIPDLVGIFLRCLLQHYIANADMVS